MALSVTFDPNCLSSQSDSASPDASVSDYNKTEKCIQLFGTQFTQLLLSGPTGIQTTTARSATAIAISMANN
jgi:hypothetical protein